MSFALDERFINFSVDLESGEVRFSNPGKSRAVIDVTYCLNLEGTDGSGGGSSSGDEGGSGGGISSGDDEGSDGVAGGGDGTRPPTDESGVINVDKGGCNAMDCDGTGI